MVGDFHGQRWTAWFLWKKDITPLDIYLPLSAIYGEKSHPYRTVFAGYSSSTEAMTEQVAVCEWYCNIPEEWFCEAIWKLPKRWQCCTI